MVNEISKGCAGGSEAVARGDVEMSPRILRPGAPSLHAAVGPVNNLS
jgi:hypothetical protein